MRWLLKSLVLLLLGLPLLAGIAWFVLQQQLTQAGISQLSFQIRQLSLHQIQLQQLKFRLDGKQPLTAGFNDLSLEWRWPAFFRPQLMAIRAAQLELQLDAPATDSGNSTPLNLSDLATSWQIPAWLPQQLQIRQMMLTLPCPAGQCQLGATLQLSSPDRENWLLQLALSSPAQQLTLTTDMQLQLGKNRQLQASVQLPEQFALSLKQQLDGLHGKTELALALSPPSGAVQAFLADWQLVVPEQVLSQFTEPVQLFVQGDWQLPTSATAQTSAPGLPLQAGDFRLLLRAPTPVLIPNLGLLKGEADLQLKVADASINTWAASAALELTELQLPTLAAQLNQPLPGIRVKLDTAAAELNPTSLPLQLSLQSLDVTPQALQLQGSAKLMLQLGQNASLILEDAAWTAAVPALQLPDAEINLTNTSLSSTLRGRWQAGQWQLQHQGTMNSVLTSPQLNTLLALQLPKLELSQQSDQPVQITATASLQLQQLQHPQLQTTDWQLHSSISGSLQALQLQGELSNTPGLTVQYQAQLDALTKLSASWQLADIFLLAGNPLQDSFRAWPELLTLQRGRLTASGQLHYPAAPQLLEAQLQLRELSGFYDRTLFTNLSGQSTVAINPEQLSLSVPQLSVQQLNHGMTLGPLQLVANYQTALAAPEQGVIELQQLQSDFLLGQLSIKPTRLDLSQPSQWLDIKLQQLDLAELLRQHPASDVVAIGKISGQIPLQLNAQRQLSVSAGQLSAEAPGGRLQYRNPAAAASSNPGMKLVFDALEDFHFSLLNSEVSYQADGTLTLGLQLQGFNPAVQQGRAINLNINLEEDIPAMLASLQLAGKLNDTLTKRVQQVIQQRQAARQAAGVKP